MFKKRRSPVRTAFNVILVILLLLGIAFLGYSVGKPIVSFLQGRENPNEQVDAPPTGSSEQTPPIDVDTEPVSEETEPVTEDIEPEPIPDPKNRIIFVGMPTSGSFEEYLDQKIAEAQNNECYGIAVELIADGGKIGYATENPTAALYKAVSENAITDLAAAVRKISDAGLLPYARISLLSDHLASWDRGISYLFEDGSSIWLDDSPANGGKPWISAFSEQSRQYMSNLVTEISNAGFAGIICGEIGFPPFRNSDLRYVGAKVQSADRYKGLIEFSNAVQEALGNAKSYAIEVDALDILSGNAEILSDLSSLNCQTVYVRYDSAKIGQRVVKSDGSEISYAGLSENDKLTLVFRTVSGIFDGSGKTVIPSVASEDSVGMLVQLGYDEQMIIVY